MWYAIIATDVADSFDLRKQHRPAHLERLHKLNAAGRLKIAGPHPTPEHPQLIEEEIAPAFSGSLLVVDFESLEAARSWAQQDPYFLNGVYADVKVKPFIPVLS